MPTYVIGGERVRRKNWYMPCAIGPRFDEADDAEQARILKATWWADLIAGSEWKALLRNPGFSPSAKSRLKKKAVGWLIALGRIGVLDPDLWWDIYDSAARLYREQTGEPHPFLREPEVAS